MSGKQDETAPRMRVVSHPTASNENETQDETHIGSQNETQNGIARNAGQTDETRRRARRKTGRRARRQGKTEYRKRKEYGTARHGKSSGKQGKTVPISNAIAHGQTGKAKRNTETQGRYERRKARAIRETKRRTERKTRRISGTQNGTQDETQDKTYERHARRNGI